MNRIPTPAQLRLVNACGDWIDAFERCRNVKTNGATIRRTDPLETFAELYLRAGLTDSIAETCDGHPLGLRQHTAKQIEGLLSPPDFRRFKWLIGIR